jgi:hypothetical protein
MKDLVWKDYINGRLIATDPTGFFVIKPNDSQEGVPLACPICDRLNRSRLDEYSWLEFKCCNACAQRWAHARREKWHAGWRPSQNDVDDELLTRPSLFVTFEID